jgi:hypothetical protein
MNGMKLLPFPPSPCVHILILWLKERETLDETLMRWKKYGGNQCKLNVIL